MFGSRRRVTTPPADAGNLGYHTEIAVVGDPDLPNIARQRVLAAEIGAGLRGYSGQAIGYDRGDPGVSLTAVMPGAPSPTAALAQLGRIADAARMAPIPQFADQVSSDPINDPYQAALFNRITR